MKKIGIIRTMQTEETIFERTYKNYLKQLKAVSFESSAQKLGAKIAGNALKIPFFDSSYEVSVEKITGPSGEKPSYDICVILSKYILLCPDKPPQKKDWISFRDFKDAGPLINYFTHDVEHAIASYFSGKCAELKKASNSLGGYPPALDVQYDFAVQFDALPMIPVMILYNDRDDEFPATCSVLFERRAEEYLDAECIAVLGRQLFSGLRKAL
jgi:effector-binding domain-containing protein